MTFLIDGSSCGVSVSIQEQSSDISAGVSEALEVRGGNNQQDRGQGISIDNQTPDQQRYQDSWEEGT